MRRRSLAIANRSRNQVRYWTTARIGSTGLQYVNDLEDHWRSSKMRYSIGYISLPSSYVVLLCTSCIVSEIFTFALHVWLPAEFEQSIRCVKTVNSPCRSLSRSLLICHILRGTGCAPLKLHKGLCCRKNTVCRLSVQH